MNPLVTEYINKSTPEQKQIMVALRHLIHESVGGVSEEFKWSRPVFRATKDFAYLKTAKGYVTLGFFHFEKLQDEKNLLKGTGKDMRHIKLKTLQDINADMLQDWFKASAS